MGNCFALCKSRKCSYYRVTAAKKKQQKVIRVVKSDGKILEFRAPILVKDLLVDFSGSAVGISKEALQHLPPNYELKLGKIYYLLPLQHHQEDSSVMESSSVNVSSSTNIETEQQHEHEHEHEHEHGGIKRIKVVITKKQLQELLSQQISVDDVISGSCSVDSSPYWKPKLEPIPE